MSSSTQNIRLNLTNTNSNSADGYTLNTADGYSWLSIPVKIKTSKQLSITIGCTGTPDGYVSLEVTNEMDDPSVRYMSPGVAGNGGTGWVTVPSSSTEVTSSTVPICYNLALQGAAWVRVRFANKSSTGSPVLSVYLTAKE